MPEDTPISRTSPSAGPGSPEVTGVYDAASGSIQYIVACPETKQAALIDVVLDFDPEAARTRTDSAEHVLSLAQKAGYDIVWVLDTHPHADHVMASAWLKVMTGAPNAIGEKVRDIAELWRGFYHLPDAFDPDADFDRLLAAGDTFRIGTLDVRVMLSPGHTLGSITYVVGRDAAFVHDTFMQPDVGTSRADFPGGTASDLYDSLMALLELPDETRLFVGHDYGTQDRRRPAWEATVAEQRRDNTHIGGGTSKAEFTKLRDARDATLPLPDRMLHALQLNLRAGRAPAPEADGHSYLKIPLNRF
ncbi:MBL fold metallo-hydrolase [Roseibacterium sp. SDUM158017]|uniref:MBL fold metallo-hydrolase n=1 Tax=Roseicyclus salinarum TaxID=3036773 RepID=UPI0024157E9D|nr:MBL fold metallo-hydrolase [Roseibacterium sp. SDUM158017]MDG4650271.1 MBL fold metallo-hydrolase [Roseibacterium sp. SDUM158017]